MQLQAVKGTRSNITDNERDIKKLPQLQIGKPNLSEDLNWGGPILNLQKVRFGLRGHDIDICLCFCGIISCFHKCSFITKTFRIKTISNEKPVNRSYKMLARFLSHHISYLWSCICTNLINLLIRNINYHISSPLH